MAGSTFFTFPLRTQQENAFVELQRFISDFSHQIFILKGYAGTGKTTLMSGLIKWLDQEKTIFSLLASTGRAAKILSDKTNSNATTVHSHIYVFDDLDDDLEKMSALQNNMKVDDKGQISLLFELKSVSIASGKIYIIDEASMISDVPDTGNSFAKFGSGRLLSDLLAFDKNGRFIFVGDPCQLPPIGQDISPALSKEYIEDKFKLATKQIELTEIIRQSSTNGIIAASLKLRNLQKTNPQVKFASFPLKGYSNILLHNSHASLVNQYIANLRKYGFEHSTLICQTNRHCSDLNEIIRSSLGKNPNRLEIGDILMVTQNNYLTNLVNGDIVEVLQVGQKEFRCGLSFLQVSVQELASKRIKNVLLVEDVLYSISTNLDKKQHKDLMIDYYYRMKDRGIEQNNPMFKEGLMTDPYLNSLKAVFGYALTCHKSQGGEWNEVFLYLDNKVHGIPKPGIYQWLYTAVTRAKETLHAVNDWFIK